MTKTRLLIIGLFIVAVVALVIAVLSSGTKQGQLPPTSPTPTPVSPFSPSFQASPTAALVPSGNTITVGPVTTNNFYKTTTPFNPQGDRNLANSGAYSITYLPDLQQFLIVITGSGFAQNRAAAEQSLLDILNVSQLDACQLNVVIRTINAANPDQAGQDYPLSFCSPTPTPTPTPEPSQNTQPVTYQTTDSLDIIVGNPPSTHPTPPNYPSNLPDAIYQQFGIKVSGMYDYENKWLWEKLWDVSNTRFDSLVKSGHPSIVAINGTAVTYYGATATITMHHFSQNAQTGFDVVVFHELGHVIDHYNPDNLSHRSELPNDVLGDRATAPSLGGWITQYAQTLCISGGKGLEVQFGEDYAEMITYYINPTAQEETACRFGPPPYANDAHPNHYKTAQEILGVY